MPQAIGFWPLKSLSEVSGVHRDSISQSGNCLGSVKVHSLILPHIFLHSQEYVMWLPSFFLARTFATSLPWLPSFLLARNLVTPLPWSQAQSYGCDIDCLSFFLGFYLMHLLIIIFFSFLFFGHTLLLRRKWCKVVN